MQDLVRMQLGVIFPCRALDLSYLTAVYAYDMGRNAIDKVPVMAYYDEFPLP